MTKKDFIKELSGFAPIITLDGLDSIDLLNLYFSKHIFDEVSMKGCAYTVAEHVFAAYGIHVEGFSMNLSSFQRELENIPCGISRYTPYCMIENYFNSRGVFGYTYTIVEHVFAAFDIEINLNEA